MTRTQRVWLTQEAHDRLQRELAALLARRTAGSGEDVTDPNSSVPHFRGPLARIRQIQDLLTNAVIGQDPPDDGTAEPGMVLTVRYDDNETETFLLGVREAEHGDIEVYSPESPLGAALTGARQGEQRDFHVPDGSTVRVTLLEAVPYGRHRSA